MAEVRFEALDGSLHELQERLKAELARNPFLDRGRDGGEGRAGGDGPSPPSSAGPPSPPE